jgi:hypothetical protein
VELLQLKFDSLLHDAVGSQISPLHYAVGSQISPLHFAAGHSRQTLSCEREIVKYLLVKWLDFNKSKKNSSVNTIVYDLNGKNLFNFILFNGNLAKKISMRI